jgi:hypothetical protein
MQIGRKLQTNKAAERADTAARGHDGSGHRTTLTLAKAQPILPALPSGCSARDHRAQALNEFQIRLERRGNGVQIQSRDLLGLLALDLT